jgi:LmbE family N-acetylglucosaminyl deacetylase
MIFNKKNVLVLAPHTDDGELGLGGTITKLLEVGAVVTYAAFSTAQESIPDGFDKDILKTEVIAATSRLGIAQKNLHLYDYRVRRLNYSRQEILEDLVRLKRDNVFDLIFVPTLNDLHQDHATVSIEGIRAFKNCTILGYELLWNNLSFNTQCFVVLEERHVEQKIAALAEYKSQSHRDYISSQFIKSWAKTRGVQIGAQWAEAFEVIRLIL